LFLVLLLRVPLEDKDFWLKALSAVLASLVFAVGIPALIVSHVAGKEQGRKIDTQQERLLLLDKEVAEAKRKQAEAEAKVLELQERAAKAERDLLKLRERAESRRFWNEKIELAIAKKRPTGNVLVTYDAAVPDASNVWFDIYRTLERAGWNVTTRARDATDPLRGPNGVSIFAWKLDMCPSDPDTAQCALWDLFCLSSLKDWHCGLDTDLPENSFRIEVLARPPMQPLVPIGTL
jgi:hypothetical protein